MIYDVTDVSLAFYFILFILLSKTTRIMKRLFLITVVRPLDKRVALLGEIR